MVNAYPTGFEYSVANIIPLFEPSSKLHQKHQQLLAEDEKAQRSTLPVIQHRRPGPRNSAYGIASSEWPTVLSRVLEKNEPFRKVADDCDVSHATIRRMVRAVRKMRQTKVSLLGTS